MDHNTVCNTMDKEFNYIGCFKSQICDRKDVTLPSLQAAALLYRRLCCWAFMFLCTAHVLRQTQFLRHTSLLTPPFRNLRMATSVKGQYTYE